MQHYNVFVMPIQVWGTQLEYHAKDNIVFGVHIQVDNCKAICYIVFRDKDNEWGFEWLEDQWGIEDWSSTSQFYSFYHEVWDAILNHYYQNYVPTQETSGYIHHE